MKPHHHRRVTVATRTGLEPVASRTRAGRACQLHQRVLHTPHGVATPSLRDGVDYAVDDLDALGRLADRLVARPLVADDGFEPLPFLAQTIHRVILGQILRRHLTVGDGLELIGYDYRGAKGVLAIGGIEDVDRRG